MATRRRSGAGRDRTSRLMLEVRGGLTQSEAAMLTADPEHDRGRINQSKISRGEQGTYTLSPDDALDYATALGASPDQTRELVELCTLAQAHAVAGQVRLTRRGSEIQRRIAELEQNAAVIRSWQPNTVPGQLQTWDYLVALIEREPDDAWTQQRRARMALIDQPERRYIQVLSEAALRWVVGSREIMAGQMDRLLELSRRPNVDIGIIEFGQTAMPPPESAFHLYGDRNASVATDVGTTFLDDRGDLAALAATFERLAAVAVWGDEAREVLERVRRIYET